MLASPLPLYFLETFSLSTSTLGCRALCIVISFLVLWFIYPSSSLVYLRNSPEYLTSGKTQVFIPLIRCLLLSFVSSSFLVLLRYSFWIFSFISTCLMVSASIIIIIIIIKQNFSHHRLMMVFQRCLRENKSPQISTTPLIVLADLSNTVILDCLHSSCYFQVLSSFYQSL